MYAVLETSNDLTATTSIWADARCRDGAGTLTHLFFSDELLDIARAKAICARCTLRAECLDGALERAEPWGVWGGELIENGQLVVNNVKMENYWDRTKPLPAKGNIELQYHGEKLYWKNIFVKELN